MSFHQHKSVKARDPKNKNTIYYTLPGRKDTFDFTSDVLDKIVKKNATYKDKKDVNDCRKLMELYKDDLDAVQIAADEQCIRIIAGTVMPDLRGTEEPLNDKDEYENTTKILLFEAIRDIQETPVKIDKKRTSDVKKLSKFLDPNNHSASVFQLQY